jgi:hypothetical protein
MADYIFNIYLNTDKGEFSEDYSLSEYTYNLPPFYFVLNEYVSAKAVIDILNSTFSCTGTNTYFAQTTLAGISVSTFDPALEVYYAVPQSYMRMDSKALVKGTSVKYSDITDSLYAFLYAIGVFDYA